MSLVQQYWGATNFIGGGSYLNTKAIFSVDEGYQYNWVGAVSSGVTTEYLRTGDYILTNIVNNGAFNQTLDLTLQDPKSVMRQSNSVFATAFNSNQVYRNTFTDANTFAVDWSNSILFGTGSIGVTLGSLVFTSGNNTAVVSKLNSFNPVRNSMMVLKWQSNQVYGQAEIDFRIGDYTAGTYARAYAHDQTIHFDSCVNGNVYSSIGATLNIGMTLNTYYWLMVTAFESTYRVYHSIDGVAFTNYITTQDTNNVSGSFDMSLYNGSGTTSIMTIGEFQVIEIANQYTVEDIVRSALAMSNITGVTFQNDFQGFNGFLSSAGSSWVTGTSNNVYIMGTATGTSWHTYIMAGRSLSDFVAEVEMRGSSQYAGIFVGITNSFYGNYTTLTTAATNSSKVENYIDSRTSYTGRGDYVNLGSSIWYKMKLVKSGNFIGWYVDNLLVNSIFGNSFDTGTSYQSFGLFAYRNNATGITMEFRNFRISQLDELVKTIQQEPNTTSDNLLTRILPLGYDAVYENSGYNFFRIGSSRDQAGLGGTSELYIDSNQSLNYLTGKDAEIVLGANTLSGLRLSNNIRQNLQADLGNINITSDGTLTSVNDINDVANAMISEDNKNLESFTVTTTGRPAVQMYDYMNFLDSYLGISHNFRIYGLERNYDAASGLYKQITTFTYDNPEL